MDSCIQLCMESINSSSFSKDVFVYNYTTRHEDIFVL
jgi:hypothetical protein